MYIKRMFLSIAVVLAFQLIYANAFSEEEFKYCKKGGMETCDPNNGTGMRNTNWWPPTEEEEYDKICLFMATSDFSYCILNHLRTCSTPINVTYYGKYYRSHLHFCNEEPHVYDGKEFCKIGGIEACNPNNGIEMRRNLWWPPADEADYHNICMFMTSYLYCMLSHSDTCYPNYYGTYLKRYYSSYFNFCNERLPINKVIRSNAMCLRRAWLEGKCYQIYRKAWIQLNRYKESEKYVQFLDNQKISVLEFEAIAMGLLNHLKKGCEIKFARKCGKDTVRYLIKGLEETQFYNYWTAIFYIDEYLPIATNLYRDLDFRMHWKQMIRNNIKIQRTRVEYNPIPGHIEGILGKKVEF